jgi:transcriptional regulator with XRE-family HTH domain
MASKKYPPLKELSRLRKASGLTIAELSSRSGVSPAGIWKIEAGAASPSLETLRKLADALGTDVRGLIPPDMSKAPQTCNTQGH